MKYIILEKDEVDNETPILSGKWYYVVPKSPLKRWWWMWCGNMYAFKDLEKAKLCLELLSTGKWKYTKNIREVVV